MIAPTVSVQLVSSDARVFTLDVVVRSGATETEHAVTLERDLLARLGPGEPAERFVRRCFDFLLERESSDSILRRFDVSVIGRYFPEFEKTIALR
jgi:hypothetical protein